MEPTTVEETLGLLKVRPNDAELYQYLGDLYVAERKVMEAWEAYMQSLRLNPDDPFTCLKFGNLLTILDDKHYARELYDRAIELEPQLAAAHWCSGALYRKQGDYALAGRAYERAVEVEPTNKQALGKLAEWRAFIDGVRRSESAPYSDA